jgi:hypothetical protein
MFKSLAWLVALIFSLGAMKRNCQWMSIMYYQQVTGADFYKVHVDAGPVHYMSFSTAEIVVLQ